MDYDLTQLDHRKFEHLVQALAVAVIAPGVSAFGDGPDNGREATFEGQTNYPSEADAWRGLLVIQAKFRQVPKGSKDDARWALAELRKELETTFAAGSARSRPDYYIFATSVNLSSAAGGGKDKAREIAAEYPLKGFGLWDRDQISTYLDLQEEVRHAFDAFITPSDVLAELKRQLHHATPDFERVISRFLERELLADQYANLEQAGKVVEEQVPISRVFVDLPLRSDPLAGEGGNFVASTLELAAERLSRETEPRIAAPGDPTIPQRGRLVLIGGPGQGKTTLGQILCQLFRTSILRSRPPGSLTPEAEAAIALMESQCEQEGIAIPTVPRFPVRIALTDLSDRLAMPAGPYSLLEVIAEIVAGKSDERLPAELFREWLGAHPWLLVLDGLDEVPASGNRAAVLDAIRDFWVDATEAKSDLLVIATTRPQGYNEDFSPATYRHVTLAELGSHQALHYGRRLALARHPTDERKRERIVAQLEKSASQASTRNLMTTPLQVTIMATLIDRGGRLPKQKWKLFSEYYRVICARELERGIAASEVLGERQADIDEIHRRVALVLQVEGERTSHAGARMSATRFGKIVAAQLRAEGHEEPQLARIAAEITTAATDRLVFLVGLEADRIGFEIRSLQEFMAAEALMHGSEADVIARLEAVAGVSSWRNVLLFAAGHCFAERRHLRANVSTLCAHLNDPAADVLAPILRPGSKLAIDLLEDGVAWNQPQYQRQLTAEAMRLVERHFDFRRLLEIAEEPSEDVYAEALARGLREPGGTGATCVLLLRELSSEEYEWADRLLEAQLPPTLEAVLETTAWEGEMIESDDERMASDPWLARRLKDLSPNLTLAQIDANADLFFDMPDKSLLALVDRLSSHRGRDRVPFDSDPDLFFLHGMRWIEPRSHSNLEEKLKEADTTVLSSEVLTGARAASAFELEPTAAELSSRLREIADRVPPGDWRALAKLSTWPMSASLLHAAGDPAALRQIAELAEEGKLGDRAEWEAAEQRWHRDGIRLEDLDYAPAVDAPFDEQIASHGFPINESVGFAQIYGGPPLIANALLEMLEASRTQRSREALTRWLIAVLEGQAPIGIPPQAQAFCKHLTEEALDLVDTVGYALAVGLEWSAELSAEESDTLDRIGRRLRVPAQGRAYESLRIHEHDMPLPSVSGDLIQNWEEGRRSGGLFRILAIGLPPGPDADLLATAPEIAARNPGAAGLLELKSGRTAEQVAAAATKIAGVATTEPIWLWEAVEALDERLGEEQTADLATAAEQAVARLWEAAIPVTPGDGMMMLRRELGRVASRLFNMRASDLDRPETWRALGFGELPPAEDPADED